MTKDKSLFEELRDASAAAKEQKALKLEEEMRKSFEEVKPYIIEEMFKRANSGFEEAILNKYNSPKEIMSWLSYGGDKGKFNFIANYFSNIGFKTDVYLTMTMTYDVVISWKPLD